MICIKTTGFSRSEIRQAAQIQIQELKQGFLTSFGEKALDLMFAHVAKSKWGIMVLALDETQDQVLGYAFGALSTSKLYWDFFLKRTPAAVFYFLPRMLSFQRVKKTIETLFYLAKDRSGNLPEAELLDLAVSGAYHGTGVAQELFNRFVEECCSRDIKNFKIPTSESLTGANRFYKKMGAVEAATIEVHQGQKTILYVYNLCEHKLAKKKDAVL